MIDHHRKRPVVREQGVKLIFELTNLCNFSCIHCIRNEEGPKNYLSVDLIKKVLQEVRPYQNVNYVAFTGGEPTLHPRFGDIVKRVVQHGYSFGFVTNAWQYRKIFETVLPYREYVKAISISIDGANESTHDDIRRRKGSFRRIMQAVSLFQANAITVQFNMVVTRSNRYELADMATLAGNLGVSALGYAHCQPTPEALAADMTLNIRERREVEAEIARLQQTYQLPIYLAGDHYNESPYHQCSQLQLREFNIDYRGFLSACCTLSNFRGGIPDTDIIADLNKVSIYEAHQRLLKKVTRVNLEKIERIAAGNLEEADKFICTHCLLHYQKSPDIKQILGGKKENIPVSAAKQA